MVERVWFSSWDQTAGWPVMIIPITIAYFHHKNTNQLRSYSEHEAANSFFMKPCVYVPAAILGIILGLNGYIYAYSVACLPVSTASLILATQLAFTALFALLLVKQKFTPYSINSVVVLTIGASVLALHTSSDKPNNESTGWYVLGFIMTLGTGLRFCLRLSCRRWS